MLNTRKGKDSDFKPRKLNITERENEIHTQKKQIDTSQSHRTMTEYFLRSIFMIHTVKEERLQLNIVFVGSLVYGL